MGTLDRAARQTLGKAANAKGKDGELRVANFLRDNGWPQAQRRVKTGWSVTGRASADLGDIDGTPKIAWQVKAGETRDTALVIARLLLEATEQAVAAGADFGFAVVRRLGKADAGSWWAWCTANDLWALIELARDPENVLLAPEAESVPVRLELRDLVRLLRRAGYGGEAAFTGILFARRAADRG
jgi:hypothetical protein